jgi:hypothetical protein
MKINSEQLLRRVERIASRRQAPSLVQATCNPLEWFKALIEAEHDPEFQRLLAEVECCEIEARIEATWSDGGEREP